MKSRYYCLNEQGEPYPGTLEEASLWLNANRDKRKVASTEVGGSRVSTVFLWMDHSWDEYGPPILWETRVFGGPLSDEQDRCSGSREQAEAMHARMVERVKASL